MSLLQWFSKFSARWPPIKVYNFLYTLFPSPADINARKYVPHKFEYILLEMHDKIHNPKICLELNAI